MKEKVEITKIVPTNLGVMFTGVASADIYPSGFVRLTYTDASTEGAHLTQAQLIKGREEFFSLVSSVQSHRPNTLKNS